MPYTALVPASALPSLRHPLRFALRVTREHPWWAVGALTAVVTAQALSSALAVLLKFVIDAAITASQGGESPHLWLLAMGYPVAYLITETTWRCSGLCGMQWITKSRAATQRILFEHLIGHSTRYFHERFAGALTNKIANAASGIGDMLSTFIWEFVPLGVSFLTTFVIASIFDLRLGLFLAGWIVVYVCFNAFLVYRKQPAAYAVASYASMLRGRMVDALSNIVAVHQSGESLFERKHMQTAIDTHRKADVRSWWLSEWILATNGLLLAIFLAGMFGGSLFLFLQGHTTVGTVVMIVTLTIDIQRGLFFIGHKMTDMMDRYSQVREGLDDILVDHEIRDDPRAKTLKVRRGQVEYHDVHFAYGRDAIFAGLQLDILPGQKVGLVGMSGAGKTTMVSLLLRHYDVTGGSLRIDDHDVRGVKQESLRRAIAVVPQDVSLFHRSIYENIRYGRLNAKKEDVVRAAKLAQADTFIKRLPRKYDTIVGERGVKLSGGQRQRIAVARALLKNAPILVLDEATSSLDSESEKAIQKALAILMKGKTVLAVAHRLSTLLAMDRIIVLDQGKIVEDGPHGVLLAKKGLYARLWKSQVEGFIQEES